MSASDLDDAIAKELPVSLKSNPRLSQWLRFGSDGTLELSPGKIEIGQGILTALAQIAAEELDINIARVRMLAATTASSPNEGVTAGSQSIEQSGSAIRHAAAEARQIYLGVAAQRLGVTRDSLKVEDGTIIGPGNLRTSYWELADAALLERNARPGIATKSPADRRLTGTSAARLDLPDKVFGRPRFLHDLIMPDLLHARVLKPASPGARLLSLNEVAAREIAGVLAVVRDGSFVGVVAETEAAALAALAALRKSAVWSQEQTLPDEKEIAAWLKSQPVASKPIALHVAAAAAKVHRSIRRQYTRPFIAHASLAPSCAIARWTNATAVHVWSHTQGVFNLRADIALTCAMPPENVVVEHVEGAGCYGHNGADDVGLDAVLLARAVPGRPVRLLWSREDELAWSPFGAAMAIDLEADLDEMGEILAWRQDIWSNGHVSRPGRAATPTLHAASLLEKPFPRFVSVDPPIAGGGGAERNAVPLYDLPAVRISNHRLLTMPLRVSSLRTLGAFANIFAIESFMDELASVRGEDPLAFRLRYLRDPRARSVLEAAARRAGWSTWARREGAGQGLAFARYKNLGAYCAVVAEVEGEYEVRVRRLVIAVDAGEVINPDGLANQIEGGAIQATSWTLLEARAHHRGLVLRRRNRACGPSSIPRRGCRPVRRDTGWDNPRLRSIFLAHPRSGSTCAGRSRGPPPTRKAALLASGLSPAGHPPLPCRLSAARRRRASGDASRGGSRGSR
jgi:CO/xanthine dehydrogenase Mo-binding subunit